MIVVVTVAGLGALAGLVAGTVAWRWAVDPTTPHVEDRSIRRYLREHPVARRLAQRHHPSPPAATVEMLGTAAAVMAIGAAAAGAVLLMIRTRTGIARTDVPFAEWAAEHATATSTDVMRAISDLGGTNVVVLSAVAAAAIAMVRDRRLAIVAFMAMVVGGQFALSNLIKYAVDRARPTIAPLTGFAGTSFPSGHSVAAAATWACIAFVLARRAGRHVRAVAFGAAVGIAVAVGATRVALGVHWTTDVLAGLLIGWAWFALCSIAFGGRLLHFGEPVAVAEAEAGRAAADAPIRS